MFCIFSKSEHEAREGVRPILKINSVFPLAGVHFWPLNFEEQNPFVFGPQNIFSEYPIPGNVRRNTLYVCGLYCVVICVAKKKPLSSRVSYLCVA